jgi:hypothetical protein
MGFNTPHTGIEKGCKCAGCNLLRKTEVDNGLTFPDHEPR